MRKNGVKKLMSSYLIIGSKLLNFTVVKMVKISRRLKTFTRRFSIVSVSFTLTFIGVVNLNIFRISEKSFSRNTKVVDNRVKRMEEKCDEYRERLRRDHVVYGDAILYNKDKGSPFIWCKVPKASSTSWTSIFLSQW